MIWFSFGNSADGEISIWLKVPDTVESIFHAFKKDLSTIFGIDPEGKAGLKAYVKDLKGNPLNEFPTTNDDPVYL